MSSIVSWICGYTLSFCNIVFAFFVTGNIASHWDITWFDLTFKEFLGGYFILGTVLLPTYAKIFGLFEQIPKEERENVVVIQIICAISIILFWGTSFIASYIFEFASTLF